MERIKQALDKARAERGSEVGATPGRANETNGSGPIGSTPIQYLQTQVHELDQTVLRENRVIYGGDDVVGLTAYKLLRTQVMQRMAVRGWNALAVTSPTPGDGKTTTAINLAISLAREMHQTVLLVDMDLRNPSMHKYFGLKPQKGISDYLLNGVSLSEVLVNPGIERLVLLPGREPLENSSEILAAPAVGVMVQELKKRYPSRIVLFDLPPVLSADDALSFAPFVDAFLLVLREGKSTREEVQHSFELLKDACIIGTVLNGSNDKVSSYY